MKFDKKLEKAAPLMPKIGMNTKQLETKIIELSIDENKKNFVFFLMETPGLKIYSCENTIEGTRK